MDFVHKAENLGATVGMDNAVPICMFTSEELSELMIKEVIWPKRNFIAIQLYISVQTSPFGDALGHPSYSTKTRRFQF